MAESENPRPKPRPIVRLGTFVISHSFIVSVLCCIAGVVALFLLPALAKNTSVSENALMPGSANPMLSNQDVMEANGLIKQITNMNLGEVDSGIGIPGLIADHMAGLGAEVNYHKFQPQWNQFYPLQFFSSPNSETIHENLSCSTYGINTIGIIRAPQGDGKEALVLVTPYNSANINHGEVLSLGIAYSVFALLTRATWLAKDIIWLASDSKFGEYNSVAAWLRDYHAPLFTGKKVSETCVPRNSHNEGFDVFRRGGTMAAALVIKVVDRPEKADKDSLSIYAEASNGQMPNLDLVNVVNYLAVHRQGFRVMVEKLWSLLDAKWIRIVGEIVESLGNFARSLNPQLKFGTNVADYVEGAATLASSLYYQALGVPTGSHGAFREYQVDAITLEISPRTSLNNVAKQSEFLLRGGRLIEGVIRSVNNLLEKFHQSYFLYLLTSPSKFVSVGVYMIPFALLVAPLPIVAASLYSNTRKPESTSKKHAFKSWKWLHAAKSVFAIHLWGAIVSLLPYFITQIPNLTETTRVLTWVLLSISILIILYSISGFPFHDWAILKSVTISAAFIGLCIMSVINFATSEIGALLLVPMCLIAQPLKFSSFRSLTRSTLNLVVGSAASPLAAFLLLKGVVDGFGTVSLGDFWNWVESLWVWNSATYLYIGMVHLPCWLLCIHILFHPC